MTSKISPDFLPINRYYMDVATGESVASIVDWAKSKKEVKLNFVYNGSREKIGSGKTLFMGLTSLPPTVPVVLQDGANDPKKIYSTLRDVVKSYWLPDKFHVIMHSSGYDSRTLSLIIKELGLKDLMFVCLEPEGPNFRTIMEKSGWPKSQYMVWNEEATHGEYYESVLTVRDFWKYTNDAQPFIWPFIDLGIPYKDIQLVKAYGGDEIFRYPIEELCRWFYYGRWSARYNIMPYGNLLNPYLHYSVLGLANPQVFLDKIIARNSSWMMRLPLVLRERLSVVSRRDFTPEDWKEVWFHNSLNWKVKSRMLPRWLRELPKGPHESVHEIRNISPKLRARVDDDFRSSWYYNTFRPMDEVPNRFYLEDFWTEFARASICEELISNGVSIR